jgi:hypothetical protein
MEAFLSFCCTFSNLELLIMYCCMSETIHFALEEIELICMPHFILLFLTNENGIFFMFLYVRIILRR